MRRIATVLLAGLLIAAVAACGASDSGGRTITVVHTNTVPADQSASDGGAATTQAAPATTTATATTTDSATPTTAAPVESTEPPTTEPAPPETTTTTPSNEPQQYTLGETATDVAPPPSDTSTAEPPPQTSEEPAPGGDRPADFPRKGEERVLALLASDIASQCTRTAADEITKDANVSVYCDLRAGDRVQAWYESFPSTAVMQRAYARFRNGRGISPNTRACAPTEQYPAEAPWFQGDQSNVLGRLLCFVESGDVWLVWSDARYRSLGWAVNRGGKKKIVWDYWRLRGAMGS